MEITELHPGMKLEAQETVTDTVTAAAMGSGSLPVYATPAMICLMEKAAADLAEQYLPEGWTSVGTVMEIAHTAPSPVGARIQAEASVVSVEGRKLVFNVRACDDCGEIGSGRHERFAVQKDRFLEKAGLRKQG